MLRFQYSVIPKSPNRSTLRPSTSLYISSSVIALGISADGRLPPAASQAFSIRSAMRVYGSFSFSSTGTAVWNSSGCPSIFTRPRPGLFSRLNAPRPTMSIYAEASGSVKVRRWVSRLYNLALMSLVWLAVITKKMPNCRPSRTSAIRSGIKYS